MTRLAFLLLAIVAMLFIGTAEVQAQCSGGGGYYGGGGGYYGGGYRGGISYSNRGFSNRGFYGGGSSIYRSSYGRSYRPYYGCLLYTSPSPRDKRQSRMPSSA